MDRIHYLWYAVAMVAAVAFFFGILAMGPTPQGYNCAMPTINKESKQ